MRKVIFVLILFPLLFNIAFSDLPAPPNTTCDNTAVISQIQQTQSMVVSTSETLGSKLVEMSIDLNDMKKAVAAVQAKNNTMQNGIDTKPSSAQMMIAVLASNVLLGGFFIGLRKAGRW